MNSARRRFLLACALAAALAVSFDNLLGFALDPFLEKTLADLFGFPVRIESLRANIITGRVHAAGLEFKNPPAFSDTPHLWTKELEFYIDFPALLRRKVLISRVVFQDLFYLIERQRFGDEKRNNIRTWLRHIRARRDARSAGAQRSPWIVDIARIEFYNSTFIFDDRTRPDRENRFVFDRLDGSLLGFRWPTDSPTNLSQKVKVKGIMGVEGPASIEVHGDANFATKHVSFDLTGFAKGGRMNEYSRFWKDYPIVVQDGTFDLAIRMICVERQIKTQTLLTLYDFKVVPAGKPADFFLGVPYTAALGFLQSQRQIRLRIPVNGDIRNPDFEFNQAFGRAFQESLGSKIRNGIRALTAGPAILAERTGKVVSETVVVTQERISGGLEKITSLVVKKEGENDGT